MKTETLDQQEFAYVTETDQTFYEAVVNVRKTVENTEGWGIFGATPFSEKLESKGFPLDESLKSINICSPKHASQFMEADPRTALCMPCSILVYTDEGTTKLATMLPGAAMPAMFPEVESAVGDLPETVSSELRNLVDRAS